MAKITQLHKYKKCRITVDLELLLETEKVNIDYMRKCTQFILDSGLKNKDKFKHADGKDILINVDLSKFVSFKYDK